MTQENVSDLSEALAVKASITPKSTESEVSGLERHKLYLAEQCVSPKDLKDMINVMGILGRDARVVGLTLTGKGSNTKLKTDVKFPDREQIKSYHFKAHAFEGKTYVNKRSVMFFGQRVSGPLVDDLDLDD